MADISIEKIKAQQWITDVNQELIEVETILKNVTNACTSIPGEDDEIMKGIDNTGKALSTFWNSMCGGFREASRLIGEAIKTIGDAADQIISEIGDAKGRIGQE